MPSLFRYCSDKPPLLGVYLATTATNPSAKDLTEEIREVNVDEDESYVPTAISDWNRAKKGWEIDVTFKDPAAFQTMIAS